MCRMAKFKRLQFVIFGACTRRWKNCTNVANPALGNTVHAIVPKTGLYVSWQRDSTTASLSLFECKCGFIGWVESTYTYWCVNIQPGECWCWMFVCKNELQPVLHNPTQASEWFNNGSAIAFCAVLSISPMCIDNKHCRFPGVKLPRAIARGSPISCCSKTWILILPIGSLILCCWPLCAQYSSGSACNCWQDCHCSNIWWSFLRHARGTSLSTYIGLIMVNVSIKRLNVSTPLSCLEHSKSCLGTSNWTARHSVPVNVLNSSNVKPLAILWRARRRWLNCHQSNAANSFARERKGSASALHNKSPWACVARWGAYAPKRAALNFEHGTDVGRAYMVSHDRGCWTFRQNVCVSVPAARGSCSPELCPTNMFRT